MTDFTTSGVRYSLCWLKQNGIEVFFVAVGRFAVCYSTIEDQIYNLFNFSTKVHKSKGRTLFVVYV